MGFKYIIITNHNISHNVADHNVTDSISVHNSTDNITVVIAGSRAHNISNAVAFSITNFLAV